MHHPRRLDLVPQTKEHNFLRPGTHPQIQQQLRSPKGAQPL